MSIQKIKLKRTKKTGTDLMIERNKLSFGEPLVDGTNKNLIIGLEGDNNSGFALGNHSISIEDNVLTLNTPDDNDKTSIEIKAANGIKLTSDANDNMLTVENDSAGDVKFKTIEVTDTISAPTITATTTFVGKLEGNASSADKVNQSLTLKAGSDDSGVTYDGLEAKTFTVPTANTTDKGDHVLGLVKGGSDITITNGNMSVTQASALYKSKDTGSAKEPVYYHVRKKTKGKQFR